MASHALAGVAGGGIAALALSLSPQFSPSGGAPLSELRRLDDRTAALERAVRAQAASSQTSATATSSDEMREMSGRLDTIVQRMSGIDGDLGTMSDRLAKLESVPQTAAGGAETRAEAERAVAPLATRLTSLEREVDKLVKLQAERQGDAKAAALAIAFTNLKRALADGRPYARELAAVESLAPRKTTLNVLTANKDTGIPTAAALIHQFGDVSKRALEKHYQGSSSSFIGQMLKRAQSAIQITPSGREGNSPEAVIGRMDQALRRGDLAGAVAEASALNGAALAEMKPWLDAAQARLAADEALKRTDAELLAVLTKSGSAR
jgi:hypothetical protein